ncbi:hypothetical protein ACCO45_004272 [Purpureocillium lilacinum]|uniref:Uncharacterized protein n=1 Tax=Purpureocillium lilacinum TaxID=33203 RepID=A0ACC4E299_PURLI
MRAACKIPNDESAVRCRALPAADLDWSNPRAARSCGLGGGAPCGGGGRRGSSSPPTQRATRQMAGRRASKQARNAASGERAGQAKVGESPCGGGKQVRDLDWLGAKVPLPNDDREPRRYRQGLAGR